MYININEFLDEYYSYYVGLKNGETKIIRQERKDRHKKIFSFEKDSYKYDLFQAYLNYKEIQNNKLIVLKYYIHKDNNIYKRLIVNYIKDKSCYSIDINGEEFLTIIKINQYQELLNWITEIISDF